MEKISNEEVEKISGGIVVAGNDGQYYTVDELGCIHVIAQSEGGALYGAHMTKQSKEVISEAEYESRFGRKLDVNFNPYN